MKQAIYYFLRKHTGDKTRMRLRSLLHDVRKFFSFAYKIRYGAFSAEDLKKEIVNKIGADFEILMVHSSFDSLLPMYSQNVFDLLKMLLSLCAGKNLVMPAFTFGGSFQDVPGYFAKNPYFDSRKTPSRVGLLSEVFRRYPGVKRSLHPRHSICAFGPLAEHLVKDHHLCPTTFGEGTPFGIMASRKTIILGIGLYYYRNLTHVHTAEDFLGDGFPIKRRIKEIPVTLVKDKERYEYKLQYADDEISRFRRLDFLEDLLDETELCQWKFKGVPLFFADAKRVTEALIEAALTGKTIYDRA